MNKGDLDESGVVLSGLISPFCFAGTNENADLINNMFL